MIVGEEVSLFDGVWFSNVSLTFLLVDKLWIVKIAHHIYCGEYTFGHKIENHPVDMWIVFGDNLCIRTG